MRKKSMLLVSFALAAVLVVGQVGYAAEADKGDGQGTMNENGMSGMMNMMENENTGKMMENEGMGKMMDAMSSPEGQAMMESCGNSMESYGDENEGVNANQSNNQVEQTKI